MANMGTDKQLILLKLAGHVVLSKSMVAGKLSLELHKAHSFVVGDEVYLSMVRFSGKPNQEASNYNGTFEVFNVPDDTHIVLDVDYESSLDVSEAMISGDFYIYDSVIFAEYISHAIDKMVCVIDTDRVMPMPVANGYTPGRTAMYIALEDAIIRHNSVRATRKAVESELYTLVNYLCLYAGAKVIDDAEYIESIDTDGNYSVKFATLISI